MTYKNYIRILFVFLFGGLSCHLFAQTSIEGVINQYARIDSVVPTKDTLHLSSNSFLEAGDTVLIMQMKGATPDLTNSNKENLGKIELMNEAGKMEFVKVSSVLSGNKVRLHRPLMHRYDGRKFLQQLIKVPSYNNARVSATLTADAWNGETGGVVALMVHDSLFLEASIDASEKGFRGALPVYSSTTIRCAGDDPDFFGRMMFAKTETNEVGRKGESVIVSQEDYDKGMGRWGNAGGGGNGRFAGGGGGGNAGSGDNSFGPSDINCTLPDYGTALPYGLKGRNGQSVIFGANTGFSDSTIYLGGGGGAGNYESGFNATAGGNGGGLVIVFCDYLIGNGGDILAAGQSVANVATAGAGGGGAGGAVFLQASQIIGAISIDVSGGDGGNTQATAEVRPGPGGGAGGGAVLFNSAATPGGVTLALDPGETGYVIGEDPLGSASEAGTQLFAVKAPLNGFLFNSIEQEQTLCAGMTPQTLKGTTPKGGDGPGSYTYQWEQRTTQGAWAIATGTANEKDYSPATLTDTLLYRRVVQSGGYSDTSNVLQIVVQPQIVNNVISEDGTACYGNIADTLKGTIITTGGDGIFDYTWQQSADQTNWTTITALNDAELLSDPIEEDTYFRRIVTSGACSDISASIMIEVYPLIENNTLTISADTICQGQVPVTIMGSEPVKGYGPGTYTYLWEKSVDENTWTPVSGAVNKDYTPGALSETTYFRRIVSSVDCEDISTVLKINVLRPIGSNVFQQSSPVYTCYNTAPELIVGSVPTGGDKNYTYQWESRTASTAWVGVQGANEKDYQPGALSEVTYLRRRVFSGEDDCCEDVSAELTIAIHELPTASLAVYDTTICSAQTISLAITLADGQAPYGIIIGNGQDSREVNEIAPGLAIVDVQPGTEQVSEVLPYQIQSVIDANGCEATAMNGQVEVTVKGVPKAAAGIDFSACQLNPSLQALPSIGTGHWHYEGDEQVAIEDAESASTTVILPNDNVYRFKWMEKNWQCKDSAYVNVKAYAQHAFQNLGNDTVVYFKDTISYELELPAVNEELYETDFFWNVSEPAYVTEQKDGFVSLDVKYSDGPEDIQVSYELQKGVCPIVTDSVMVHLKGVVPPTGFSPNGDNLNETLQIRGLENKLGEIHIFNRWGVEVYSNSHYDNADGWHGLDKNGNELPEDSYYYVLKITDEENGRQYSYKGYIVLKRH